MIPCMSDLVEYEIQRLGTSLLVQLNAKNMSVSVTFSV